MRDEMRLNWTLPSVYYKFIAGTEIKKNLHTLQPMVLAFLPVTWLPRPSPRPNGNDRVTVQRLENHQIYQDAIFLSSTVKPFWNWLKLHFTGSVANRWNQLLFLETIICIWWGSDAFFMKLLCFILWIGHNKCPIFAIFVNLWNVDGVFLNPKGIKVDWSINTVFCHKCGFGGKRVFLVTLHVPKIYWN